MKGSAEETREGKYSDDDVIFAGGSHLLTLILPHFREFAKEKERVESRAGFMQLKQQQKLEKELNG